VEVIRVGKKERNKEKETNMVWIGLFGPMSKHKVNPEAATSLSTIYSCFSLPIWCLKAWLLACKRQGQSGSHGLHCWHCTTKEKA